jgi:hypothetical protein
MPVKQGNMLAGLFKSQQRAKQKTNSKQRLGHKETHLLGNIGNANEIEQGEQERHCVIW